MISQSPELLPSNIRKSRLLIPLKGLVVGGLALVAALAIANELEGKPEPLGVATFTGSGALEKPKGMDKWVHMGSNIGHGYNGESFARDDPGTFRVVEMEPTAYDYFLEHGEYADGTMSSLSVYDTVSKVEPDLNGFSQGKLRGFEIHLIDSTRNSDGREFFMFAAAGERAEPLADQSVCVNCHLQEGKFKSTFVQFYPKLPVN